MIRFQPCTPSKFISRNTPLTIPVTNMKPPCILRSLLAVSCSMLLANSSLQAADYWWDSNSTTAGFGSTNGTWGTSSFWSTDSTGASATANTTILSTDDVHFGTASDGYTGGRTVTISGTRTFNSMTIGLASNAIAFSGGTALNLGNANTVITQNSASNTTISTVIGGGTNGLTKAGSGRLILTGVNTYSGNTVVGGGILRFGSTWNDSWANGRLPATSNLEINGGIVEAYYYLTRTLGAGAGQIQFTGGRSGLTNLQGDASAAYMTFTNAATTVTWGSAAFNPSMLVLNDVGAASTMRWVNPFDLNGASRTIEVSATGAGGGRGTYGTMEGVLSGAGGSLTKTGVGTLLLNGANSYGGGTSIDGGALWFHRTTAMPNSGAVTVNDGGILAVSVGNAGGWTTGTSGEGTIGGLLAGLGGQSGGTVSYSGNVGLGLYVTGTQTFAGDISNVGDSLALNVGNKDGGTGSDPFTQNGTLALSGTNSYTGKTTVYFGSTLRFVNQSSLYNDTPASWTAANLNVKSGATLAFNVGGTNQFTTGSVTTLLTNLATSSGAGNGMESGSVLGFDTTNAAGGTFTIADTIANITGAGGSARNIAKLGTNTLVLSGPNTYTGTTTVSAGTLQAGVASVAGVSGAFGLNNVVNMANVAGATLDLNGFNTRVGALTGGGTTGGSVALNGGAELTVGTANTNASFAGNMTGNGNLIKTGTGTHSFSGTLSFTGTATASQGVLDFANANITSMGGGASSRDITVASGAAVRFNNLTNTQLKRIVETTDEITVMTGTTTTGTVDFSSSTGANLPNAFLGNWAGNGAKAEYNVTITPASDNYRLGGRLSSGLLGIQSVLSGTQGLIVGGTGATGIRVNLVAANTFTGDTVINTGSRLTLGNNLALQNSALNVGSAGGNFSLAAGTNGGRITGETAAPSPTFGGLIGSRNLLTVFSNSAGNNESNLAASAVTGFTLNVGSGKTATYSGVIANFAAGTKITKTGTGTQVFHNATHTYTGATTVTAGALIISGSGSINASSGVTIDGGTLGYNSSIDLSAPVTFTSGTIAGTNLNGSLSGQTIGTGQIVSPGNSPGTANTGSQSWAAGGSYLWEINDATGTPGVEPGWDLLAGTGTLDITATSGSPFNILVTSLTLANAAGAAVNFADLSAFNWLIADFANPVSGFAANKFAVDTSAFANAFTGTFGVALGDTIGGGDDTQVYLTYVPIPEPRAALLAGLALLAAAARRRRA
jgi:autotransporter-associated beta strand protein